MAFLLPGIYNIGYEIASVSALPDEKLLSSKGGIARQVDAELSEAGLISGGGEVG